MRRRWPRAKALQRPERTALLPASRRMSTGQSNLPSGRAGGVNHPPDCVRQPEGAEARGIDDDEELQEAGSRPDEGSQHRRHQGARSGDHSVHWWGQRICSRGRGPRAASTSQSTRSMLPRARGAGAAASGDGEFRAPPGAGPLRVRAPEAPEAARFASSCLSAPMQRGLPAPGQDLRLVPAARGASATLCSRA
jgi:hypothetical protein